jgi:hypothetical protein
MIKDSSSLYYVPVCAGITSIIFAVSFENWDIGNQNEKNVHTLVIATAYKIKSSVSEIGILCLLPAVMKLWNLN